jgi:competence protein ComEC
MVTHNSDDRLCIHVIDVGQGDSILLEGPDGDTMLVDSGNWMDEGKTTLEYLDKHDIDHIDNFIATHYDGDHIGGHAAIIEEFGTGSIGEVYGSKKEGMKEKDTVAMNQYKKALKENDLEEKGLEEGSSTLGINDVDVDVLNPSSDIDSTKHNENSIVLQVTYGKHSV